MKYFFFLFGVFFLTTICAQVTYDGYKVFRLKPIDEKQKKFLSKLVVGNYTLDFWRGVNNAGLPVDVMVRPEEQNSFIASMRNLGITTDVMIEDVQVLIDAERASTVPKAGMHWKNYHDLDSIHSWLDTLAAEYSEVSIIELGATENGESLKGVKVSFGSGKRSVFLEGGIHAREWISPATVTYILNEILTSKDPAIRKIAESFDWHIFPSINPSGYVYSHTTDRLWRKTRTPYENCYGADPNRNWDMRWGGDGSSGHPCFETYRGPKPFSEKGTLALSQYIEGFGSTIDVYLAFHSYSQLMMLPYGYTHEHLDNYDEVKKIGIAAAVSLAKRYGTRYLVGNVAEIIYVADGSSMDWIKYEFKSKIALTYELRDTGKYGFLLPPGQIIPNCEEVMDSVVTIFQEGEKLGYFTLD